MAYWLSKQAVIGGWFFMGMAGFALCLIIFGAVRAASQPISDVEVVIGPVMTLLLALVGTGVWLMRRRPKIRRLLDDPLYAGHGRVLSKKQDSYGGYVLELQAQRELDAPLKAKLSYIGHADWDVSDEIELIFWDNGRFCPRHFDHMVSLGHLPTPARKQMMRRRITIGILIYFFFVALAIIMALYSQGRL